MKIKTYIMFMFGLFILCISGCMIASKPDYSNIPLTSGDAPYRIQKGPITDSRGIIHNEKDYRWSVSEQWLYESIQNTK